MQALQVYASTERQEVGPVGAHPSEEGAIHTHADMAQIQRMRRSHTHSRGAKSVHKLNEQPSPRRATVTWWSSAVNCVRSSFRATSRTPNRPLDSLAQLCVRSGVGCSMFSLVGRFHRRSDTSLVLRGRPTPRRRPWWTSSSCPSPPDAPRRSRRVSTGSPGSRAWSFHACLGS